MDRNRVLPRRILWILAALSAVAAGIFFRLYPLTVYPEYAARNNARVMVYSGIQASIERSLASGFPGLPAARRNELKRSALKKYTSARFAAGICGGMILPLLILTLESQSPWSSLLLAGYCSSMFVLLLVGEMLERYLFFRAVVPLKMPGGIVGK